MEWELQDKDENEEFWIVGNKEKDKDFGQVWTFLADVFIDKKKNKSEIDFDVYTFPRHIVEDSGWNTLRDAITDLRESIKDLERIDTKSKEIGIKVISDQFIGFKTSVKVNSIEKGVIEKKISELRKLR